MSLTISSKRLGLLSYRPALAFLTLCLPWLLGCGGAEPEPVATAPVAAAPSTPEMAMEDESADDGGQAYGGGSYGDGASGPEQSYEESSSMDRMRMMSEQGGADSSMYDSSGASGSGGSMDYGSNMMGMSGYGSGGNTAPQFATAVQFVRTNCINCHGPQQTKGDTRLDGLTDDFTHTGNATTWHAVLQQLESGAMPPPSVPRRPDAKQQTVVQALIKSALIKADFVPLQDRDYLSQAEYAFSSGKEAKAVDLLYAQAIAADEDVAAETLSQARWSSLSLRPALALRFAVGVVLDAPDGLTDLKPIGVSQSGGGGGGGGSMGTSSAGRNDGTSAERTLQQFTGDFGAALATSFESRWMDGRLGTPFKDIEPAAPPASTNPGANSMGMMGSSSGSMSGMDGGYSGGYPGGDGSGSSGGYPGGDGSGSGPTATATKTMTKGTVVTPGMVYIGTGTQIELLQRAKDQAYDGLFLFEVKAAPKRRSSLIENATRLRLMGLDGKNIAATSTLVNIDIERDKLRGVENDSLSKNIDRFFASFDEKVSLTNLPSLKPEHAQDRIRQLLVDPQVSDLVKLFEARLYHSMDLLTDNELAQVYQIILRGNDGLALANGSLADRRLVLDAVLAGKEKN